jgi:hypothetical protein
MIEAVQIFSVAATACEEATMRTDRIVDQRGHIAGSRKGKVHCSFDEQELEAAWDLGRKLRLKESTLRIWFRAWEPDEGKAREVECEGSQDRG